MLQTYSFLHRDCLLLPLQATPPTICCSYAVIFLSLLLLLFIFTFFLSCFTYSIFFLLFCDTCRPPLAPALSVAPCCLLYPATPLPLLQPNVERGNLVASVVCAAFTPTVCRTLKVKKDHSPACGHWAEPQPDPESPSGPVTLPTVGEEHLLFLFSYCSSSSFWRRVV